MMKRRPLGYLAHSYSADPENNVIASCHWFEYFVKVLGVSVLNPLLSHYHHVMSFNTMDYDDWLNMDLDYISHCDFLFVCKDEDSKGVATEVNFARAHNIPVFYTLSTLKEFLYEDFGIEYQD